MSRAKIMQPKSLGEITIFFCQTFSHQEFQVPKMEVLNLIRLFWGWYWKKIYVPWKKKHVPWKKYLRPLEKKFRLLWPCGPLVLWSSGPLVLCSSGPVVLWSSGPVVLWSCGPLVLWSCGPLVLWSCGPLVLWSCSALALWSRGPLAKAWKEICRDPKCLEGMQKEVRKTKKRDH